MSILRDDYVEINQGGTAGTPGTGTYGPSFIGDILDQAGVQNPASSADPTTLSVFEGLIVWRDDVSYLWDGTTYADSSLNAGQAPLNDAGNFYVVDVVEDAFQQIGQDHEDYDTLIGTAANATHLGTFTGNIIPNNPSIKAAIQSLEVDLDALQSLSGVADQAVNLGVFTGVTIPNNITVKAALQSLETAVDELDWIGLPLIT